MARELNMANRQCCDVHILDYATMKPWMLVDFCNTTTAGFSADAVYANKKGAKDIKFDNPLEGTMKLNFQVHPFQIYALYSDGEIETSALIARRENVTGAAEGKLTLTNTPKAGTVENYFNLRRTGKVYQTKIWKFATNPTSTGEKLLDNAGLEFVPSTDTTEGKDDYLNGNHPMFEWVHCNYKRNDDGTAYPVATEYDSNYATTVAVDVGAMQMSFYWNWDASNAEYDLVTISDMPNTKYGLKPWTECKRANGTVLPYCIGSAYVSGVASDGLLRSQPGLKPERNQSHNNMITNYQKKGKGHWGAGAERNTFQILFNIIKGATKNSQSLFQGCTSYNFQYSASIQSADAHTYFPGSIYNPFS